jgi:hypothetical protein
LNDRRDSELDREIERLLSVDPSPEFVARVRTHVARNRGQAYPYFKWALAGAAAAAAIILFVVFVPALQPGELARHEPVVAVPLVPSPPPPVESPVAPPAATRSVRYATHARGQVDPEVLVDPGEAAALQRFLDGVHDGTIDLAKLAEIRRFTAELRPPEDITPMPIAALEPITIDPLIRARDEGVKQ